MKIQLVPFNRLFKPNHDSNRYTNIDMFKFHGKYKHILYDDIRYDTRAKLINKVKEHLLNKLNDRQEVFVLKINDKILCQNIKTQRLTNTDMDDYDSIVCPIMFNADICRRKIGSTTIIAYDRFACGIDNNGVGPGIRYLFKENMSYKPGSVLFPYAL